MEDKHPRFAERTEALRQTAFTLRAVADAVLAEVQHMEAAQQRFAARKSPRRP